MAFFRRTFSRRLLPDRFQEITERVYVFDCCLSTKELGDQDYGLYMETAVSNIQRHHPGASFMVFNFKEGDDPSLLSDILSHHDMTVVDYPRHYEGYPILPLEMINYFLRSSDSWLSLEGQRNVILMHCERRGWPALAFMLAGLLLYTKKQSGELKTLDLVLKNSPKELWTPLSLMNPRPSQLRYLKYISGRSLNSDWPPTNAALLIQSVVLTDLPLFDAGKGCRPVVHVYCQDPSAKNNARPRLLCSSLMSDDGAHYFRKEECAWVKINLNCRVQGDVFIECIHLGDDLVSEEKIFKALFHTAFVQSYALLLNSTEVDVLSNANCKIPNDFKVEVLFQNPEEVQRSIAKGMASLESGHESESEFFEPEEFDIAVAQHQNSVNLLSKEALFSKLTTEVTNLDHQTEDKRKDSDLSSFRSIEPENDIVNLEAQNKKIIEEDSLSQDQSSEQVSEVDNVPVHYPTDEHSSHHTSAKGNCVLYDEEAIVKSDRVMEITGTKVQVRDQSVFSVGENEEEHDSVKFDVVGGSKKEGSEVASSLIDYKANKVVAEVEETTKGVATLESAMELISNPEDSFKALDLSVDSEFGVTEDPILASPLEASLKPKIVVESEYEPIIMQEVVNQGSEDESKIASSLIAYEASEDIVEVEETTKDGSASASLEETTEFINNAVKNVILLEKIDEDNSEAPHISVDAEFREIKDYSSEARLEPTILQEVVNQGSEDRSEIASSLIAFKASKDIVEEEESAKDGSTSASLEATMELINNAMESVVLLEKKQEDSSKEPDMSVVADLIDFGDYPVEARLEPTILQEVVNQRSADGSEIASSLTAYIASKDIVEAEESAKDGSTSASLEANMEIFNNAMESVVLLEKKQEDSSKQPDMSLVADLIDFEDYLSEARLEPTVWQEVVNQGSEEGSDIASSLMAYEESKHIVEAEESAKDGSTSASLEATMDLINNAMKSVILLEKEQEDSSKEPDMPVDAEIRELEARLEPKFEPMISQEMVNQGSEDGSDIVIQESLSDETRNSSKTAIFLGEITQVSPSEAGLELNLPEKRFLAVQESQENSPRTGSISNLEATEGSEQGCSEISSSEIEFENCIMSKSFTSIEGSEDSSEAACSQTGSELFLVAQATSSEPTKATKHIVVVVEESNGHEVKVQVEPRAASDVGSRGVQQKPKSKKKPMRLADAVAKVTMQKRVISMWVPRNKQLNSDDAKDRASPYKWVPKESGSTSEEASKPAN